MGERGRLSRVGVGVAARVAQFNDAAAAWRRGGKVQVLSSGWHRSRMPVAAWSSARTFEIDTLSVSRLERVLISLGEDVLCADM